MKIQGLRKQVTGKRFFIVITAALLSGCLETASPPGGGGLAVDASDNTAPQISGKPKLVAVMSNTYGFSPSASDGDGDALTFNIRNKPHWASFNTVTGRLEGIPQFGDLGTYDGIEISVSDGIATAKLAPFSITVSQDALGAVTLEWMPPESNTDGSSATDLEGYVIYWGTESGAYDQQVRIDSIGLTAYVVEGLRPATYYFTATAFNSAGIESDYSNEVMRTVVVN